MVAVRRPLLFSVIGAYRRPLFSRPPKNKSGRRRRYINAAAAPAAPQSCRGTVGHFFSKVADVAPLWPDVPSVGHFFQESWKKWPTVPRHGRKSFHVVVPSATFVAGRGARAPAGGPARPPKKVADVGHP